MPGLLTRNDLVRRKDLRNERRRNERKMLEAVDELFADALPVSMGVRAADTGVTASVERVKPRRNGEASGSSAFRVDGLRSDEMPRVMFNTFW